AFLVDPGEFVQAGQSVIPLAASDALELEAQVPAHPLDAIQAGGAGPAGVARDGQQPQGRVREGARGSSGDSAVYPLVIDLAAASLRSGDALEAGIRRQQARALLIPMSAVMRSAAGLAVFRVNAEQVQRVAIDVRQLLGEEVLLEPGA